MESLAWVTTTAGRKRVRANCSGGLVLVRARGLMQLTEQFFLRIVAAQRRYAPLAAQRA